VEATLRMPNESLLAGTPQMLGRYELLAPLARGGMGQVWVGRIHGARGFNKLVAVKTLLAMPESEERFESMLLEEARLAALIHHPNVVQTLELGEHEGSLYLVMEWVDGEPLGFVMQQAEARGGVPLAIGVNLIGQTLLGLHAAHELTDDKGAALGVVHRDVSPFNVLVTYAGVAKLVDFGIAKAMNQSVTHSGEIKGKISYMAPEQVRCAGVDRRADIFSLGIVLYLITTRRHPFKGENSANTLHRITDDAPADPPSRWIPSYPPALEAVVLKALEKSPERRFRSAEDMLDALRGALPEAFDSSGQTQLKQFMSDLLGKRAALRREALRRAQLRADSRAQAHATTAILGSNASPAQSGSSLRALSVDSPGARSRWTALLRTPRWSRPPPTRIARRSAHRAASGCGWVSQVRSRWAAPSCSCAQVTRRSAALTFARTWSSSRPPALRPPYPPQGSRRAAPLKRVRPRRVRVRARAQRRHTVRSAPTRFPPGHTSIGGSSASPR
jgi:eukaryotic-like serine/threonine-protein kinase